MNPKNTLLRILLFVGVLFISELTKTDLSASVAFVQFLPLALAAVSSISGIAQKSQASREERRNQLPMLGADPNIAMNQALARQQASQGLGSQVYNNQLNQMQQGLATGLRQVGARGINGINTNAFLRNYNQGLGNLNAQDTQARINNQRTLMQANTQMAAENNRVFQWNQAQPFLRNAQNVQSLRSAGNQNIISGLGGAVNGLMINNQNKFLQQSLMGNSPNTTSVNLPWYNNSSLFGLGNGSIS